MPRRRSAPSTRHHERTRAGAVGDGADRQPALVDGRRRGRRRGAEAVAGQGRLTVGCELVVDGVASASRLFENQLDEAVALARAVLADPAAHAAAVEWAVFGGALALALMGRGEEVEAVAKRGHEIDDKVDGLLRYLTAFGEVRALVARRRLRHRGKAIRRHRPDHLGGPVPGVGHGQRSGRHGRTRARPIRRHRRPDGADRRRADVGVGGVVELPGPPPAGAVVLRAGPRSNPGAKMVAELRTR